MADVAILIKTLFRERSLVNCLTSIGRYATGVTFRLYIADDGPLSENKKKLYVNLRERGHHILTLPLDSGAGRSRNLLLNSLRNEKYVLRMDDDFAFGEETNLQAMLEILKSDGGIGAVADLERQIGDGKGTVDGEISVAQGYFNVDGATLTKRLVPLDHFDYQWANGYRYAYADFTRNMLLIRREVFDTARWDERLRFGREHEDFLLQLMRSPWRVAFTPDSVHEHREDLSADVPHEYLAIKQKKDSEDLPDIERILNEKWGISEIRDHYPLAIKLQLWKRRLFAAACRRDARVHE